MKVKDLLIDVLINTKLFEMAYAKKAAIDKTRNLQDQIAQHLIKVVMYQNSQYLNHWFSELNSWLNRIKLIKLKPTNHTLDRKTLFLLLFDEPLGTISDVQDRMNDAYREMPELKIDQPNAGIVNKILYDALNQICFDIEHKRFEDIKNYFGVKDML